MNFPLRAALCACTCAAMTSCESLGSALMAPVKLLQNTMSSVGRTIGAAASVDEPDATSNSVAARGKLIEVRAAQHSQAQQADSETVAQR